MSKYDDDAKYSSSDDEGADDYKGVSSPPMAHLVYQKDIPPSILGLGYQGVWNQTSGG